MNLLPYNRKLALLLPSIPSQTFRAMGRYSSFLQLTSQKTAICNRVTERKSVQIMQI